MCSQPCSCHAKTCRDFVEPPLLPGRKGMILCLGSFWPPSMGNLSSICIWRRKCKRGEGRQGFTGRAQERRQNLSRDLQPFPPLEPILEALEVLEPILEALEAFPAPAAAPAEDQSLQGTEGAGCALPLVCLWPDPFPAI